MIQLEKAVNLLFLCYNIALRKREEIKISISNKDCKNETKAESRSSTNAQKIPQRVSRESSGTYDEYGTNTSYAAYEADNSYELYFGTYQDYHDFKKFQTEKLRHESNQSSDTASHFS